MQRSLPSRICTEDGLDKEGDESRIELQEFLTDIIGLPLPHELSTWHEVDALIALAIGKLLIQGKAKSAGNSEEGLIYF